MTDTGESKSHQPTQKKLDDVRSRGEIVRSQEINSATVYVVFFSGITLFGPSFVEDFTFVLMKSWETGIRNLAPESIDALRESLQIQLKIVGIFLTVMPLSVILVNASRKGIIFTPSNINLKLSRISPIEGVKNKLGPNGIFDFVKGLVKSSVFVLFITLLISPPLGDLPYFTQLEYSQSLSYIFARIIETFTYVAAISVAFSIIDFIWQRRKFIKKNMMSFQEIKEEMKESEGDPHFRAARRQRGIELTSNQLSQAVKDADVVIVNPTHFATALLWDPRQAPAPIVCATGIDQKALRIKAFAEEYAVPIFIDVPTARSLAMNLKIGDSIDPQHYAAVAAAIRFSKNQRGVYK